MLTKKWGRWLVVAMVFGALFMGPVGASDCQAVCYADDGNIYAWKSVVNLTDVLDWYNGAVLQSYYGYFCNASEYLSYAYQYASEAYSYSYEAANYFDFDGIPFYAFYYTYYVWYYMFYAAYYAQFACDYNDDSIYEYAVVYSYNSIYNLYDALDFAIPTAFGGNPLYP